MAVAALVWLCGAARAGDVSFRYLGTLSSGMSGNSSPRAISADLSTVVGWSTSDIPDHSYCAMYWTEAGGMQPILSPVPAHGQACAVSADGQTIVGYAATQGGAETAWRWTSSGGFQWLCPPGTTLNPSRALDVSADGSVIVGSHMVDGTSWAFRWTEAEGMVSLDRASGYIPGFANGISADGSVIVGGYHFNSNYWTADAGCVEVKDMCGFGVLGVSADGTTLLGAGDGGWVVRWTAARGLERLCSGLPHAISGDGSVVVGEGVAGAFVWDEKDGQRLVVDLLENAGIDMTGWTLVCAYGVSDDGTVIVGEGCHVSGRSGAWMMVLPEPGTMGLVGLGLAALVRRGRRAG